MADSLANIEAQLKRRRKAMQIQSGSDPLAGIDEQLKRLQDRVATIKPSATKGSVPVKPSRTRTVEDTSVAPPAAYPNIGALRRLESEAGDYTPYTPRIALPLTAGIQKTPLAQKIAGSDIAKSWEYGEGQASELFGKALEYLGAENIGESLQQSGKQKMARSGAPEAKEWEGWRSLVDPEYLTTTAVRQIPTTLGFMAAAAPLALGGEAIAGAAGLGALGSAITGAVAAGIPTTILEAGMEAQSVYDEALSRGMTEEEATKAASKVFKQNAAVLAAPNMAEMALVFLPLPQPLKQALKGTGKARKAITSGARVAGAGTLEGGQELSQEYISAGALGDKVTKAQAQEAFGLGAIMGGPFGAVGAARDIAEKDTAADRQVPSQQATPEPQAGEIIKSPTNTDLTVVGADPVDANKIVVIHPATGRRLSLSRQSLGITGRVATTPIRGQQEQTVEEAVPAAIPEVQAPEVQPFVAGQTVANIRTGEPMTVLNDTNPAFVLVQKQDGSRELVAREEISPAEAQTPVGVADIVQAQVPGGIPVVSERAPQVAPESDEIVLPGLIIPEGTETGLVEAQSEPVVDGEIRPKTELLGEYTPGTILVSDKAPGQRLVVTGVDPNKPGRVLAQPEGGGMKRSVSKKDWQPESVTETVSMPVEEKTVVEPAVESAEESVTEPSAPATEAVPVKKDLSKVTATHLRKQAQAMQKTIDAKRNPAIADQNPTPRRAKIAAGMAMEAEALEDIQTKINIVAQAMEDGTIPESLTGITKKTQVETLRKLSKAKYPKVEATLGKYNTQDLLAATEGVKGSAQLRKKLKARLDALGQDEYVIPIRTKAELQEIETLVRMAGDKLNNYIKSNIKDSLADFKRLLELGIDSQDKLDQAISDFKELTQDDGKPKEKTREQKIKAAERELIGTKIEGYFPTPKAVVERMLEEADIQPGMKVLEPSAGKGNIADAIREAEPQADLDVIEINSQLRNILESKGYNIVGTDFLEYKEVKYDRIVMNPPFEKGRDIEHVKHAFELLKPGGMVVSIMSEGTFFRGDKKATEFRDWLEENEGTSEKLPEGSFKSSERPTGVATRLVVINKPEAVTEYKGQPKFKAQPGTPEADLAVLRRAVKQRRFGPITINKVELAPEALSRPEFQATTVIAEKLGLRVVAFKGKGARGIQDGRTIYLNENLKDPLDYVFWHEVGHTMEVTHPEHYGRLMGIALDHIQDAHKLQSHYKAQDYALEDMPHEFAADVFAESIVTPGFFERLRNEAPELIKPLLEAIEQLIARIKQAVSKDDSVLPYLREVEALQERIRKEVVEPYFKDAMGEKQFVEMFGRKWQEPAAKTKAETRYKLERSKKPVRETKFNLQNSEVQERMEAARGVPKESMRARIAEMWEEAKRKTTREYEWLPRTGEFAELRQALLKLSKQKKVAADETLRVLDDITKPLDEYEYSLFSYKVIFDDLAHEADEGHMLPFGLTPETLAAEKAEVDKAVEQNPKVAEAIEKRHKAWNDLKDNYIKACKSVGFKVEDRLTKENYYRHQVLEYANAKGVTGTGKKLRTPTNRGFLRKREGSTYDINTDYLQAEFEVMAQMYYDTEIAKTIEVVKKHYDIVGQLKREAIRRNDQAMLEYFEGVIEEYGMDTDPGKLYRKLLNQKQAIAISRLEELAAKGELPADPERRFEPVIQQLADSHFTKIAKNEGADITLDNELPEKKFHEEFYAYLNWLSKGEEGQAKISALTVFKGMAEKKATIKKALGKKYVTWEDLIPEGYTTWQPREGNIFYMVDSIPERIAEALYSGVLEEAGITGDMLNKVLAMGQKFPEMVVKKEVALTLDELHKDARKEGPLAKFYHGAIRAWKQWQLIFLKRYFKYNVRNFTGDFDAIISGNPGALKKVSQAWKDLREAFFSKENKMSPELRQWFVRGGFETLFQAQEISDINRNRQFRHLMESKIKRTPIEKLVNMPKDAWFKYWDFARTTTDFREALLRYACYLDYLEQVQNNKEGRPRNFGASNRDEIMALGDKRDRAFKLANELLGAYDEVSVTGKWLADNLLPFWRWQEVNFVRYGRLFKNAYQDGQLMATVGRKVAGVPIRSVMVAIQIGKMLVKASLLIAMITTWNMLFFRDEEDDLPEDVKSRLHIVLGRDKQGEVIYFSRLGAFQDFLDWFGIDTVHQHTRNLLSGRRTIKEVASDMVKNPFNKAFTSFGPQVTIPLGLVGNIELFPEPLKPKRVYDKMEFLFNSFGLKDEYKELTGKPTPGYSKSLSEIFVYKSDPGQSAYYATKDEKARFMKKINKYSEGWRESPRGEALYNVRLAIRYKDQDAARKYLLEYIALGGNAKGLEQSLKSQHPLYGLTDEEKLEFLKQLDNRGRETFIKAMEYYETVINPL